VNRISRRIVFVHATLLIATLSTAGPRSTSMDAAGIAGVWMINRDLSPALPDDREFDGPRAQPPSGGREGRRGFPVGAVGGSPGGMGVAPRSSENERRRMAIVRRRLTEAPDRFTIAIDGAQIAIIDAYGRTTRLRADGKKQQRVTGDGELTSKTRFDGERLIVEEDFDGLKLITTYEPMTAEGRRLQVTIRAEGLPRRGRQRSGDAAPNRLVRVYDAER